MSRDRVNSHRLWTVGRTSFGGNTINADLCRERLPSIRRGRKCLRLTWAFRLIFNTSLSSLIVRSSSDAGRYRGKFSLWNLIICKPVKDCEGLLKPLPLGWSPRRQKTAERNCLRTHKRWKLLLPFVTLEILFFCKCAKAVGLNWNFLAQSLLFVIKTYVYQKPCFYPSEL